MKIDTLPTPSSEGLTLSIVLLRSFAIYVPYYKKSKDVGPQTGFSKAIGSTAVVARHESFFLFLLFYSLFFDSLVYIMDTRLLHNTAKWTNLIHPPY